MSPQVNQLHDVMQQYLPWHKARVTFTAAFIFVAHHLTTVNFTKLSNALNGQAKPASNYRRIQRFFAHFDLSGDCDAIDLATRVGFHHLRSYELEVRKI